MPPSRSRFWRWAGISALCGMAVLVAVASIVIHYAEPILKGRLIETLSTRFESRVELETLNVSVLYGLKVSGDHLRIYAPDEVVAAGAHQPIIAIAEFSFHSGLLGLFVKPMHVRLVKVSGLEANIPPREVWQRAGAERKHKGKIKVAVDEFICDNSRLTLGASNPDKDPKDFELRHIALRKVGPNTPWRYDAVLTNAIPRGEIHSQGEFGPWQTESPGDSHVTGHYTFDHADLNTIKGIGGTLNSVGDFKGQLDKIVIDGTTDTANFSLDSADHPVPLATRFHAVVDGTSGDTYLDPVQAKLRDSSFTARGAVINVKGRGHRITLDVDVRDAHIQDFLELTVKTEPPVMRGFIETKTKLQIRAGKESVTQKLSFAGDFSLREMHFANPKVQDKVDMLSLRAEGKPQEAKPGAPDIPSQMTGVFRMGGGVIQFSELNYALPGARVNLRGEYSLNGERFDFYGKVFTKASLSHMVASRWASLLLAPVSPFFRGKNGGAAIPVSISGTRAAPKFGLDVFGHHGAEERERGNQEQ